MKRYLERAAWCQPVAARDHVRRQDGFSEVEGPPLACDEKRYPVYMWRYPRADGVKPQKKRSQPYSSYAVEQVGEA